MAPEHVLRKIHHCTFGREISQRPILGVNPKIWHFIILSLKNSDYLFLVIALFTIFYPSIFFHIWHIAPLSSSSLTPRFPGKNYFWTSFFYDFTNFISQKFWWPFFSHRPFYDFPPFRILLFNDFLPFRILQIITPVSYCLHTIHPFYTHPHAAFHVSTPQRRQSGLKSGGGS